MRRLASYGLIISGIVAFVLATGYFFQLPWALSTWPWPDGRLTYLFVSSILAAIAIAVIWIGVSHEWSQMAAGAINLVVTTGGIATFLLLHAYRTDQRQFLLYAAVGFAMLLANVGFFVWAHRLPLVDPTPLPGVVRFSYALFTAILVVVGIALIRQTPNIMPWPLQPETSVLIGFIFFGDAFYFLYAVMRPYWESGRAQLWSFLFYDLVLIGPFLAHLNHVRPDLRDNLLVYIAVLLYSGALAVYYLFIQPATRFWSRPLFVHR
jgi:hypothetical protein